MTTAAENFQELCAANYKAWSSLMTAWTAAVTDVYAAVAEWAVEEREFLGVGEGIAYVTPTRNMVLRANLVSVVDQSAAPAQVPQGAITLTPATITADAAAVRPIRVVVKVDLGDVSAPAYKGEVVDENGTVVDDTVYVPMMSG